MRGVKSLTLVIKSGNILKLRTFMVRHIIRISNLILVARLSKGRHSHIDILIILISIGCEILEPDLIVNPIWLKSVIK